MADTKFAGFYQDELLDWVAELECCNCQHIRHKPPWIPRPKVQTPDGRGSQLTQSLNYALCDGEPNRNLIR